MKLSLLSSLVLLFSSLSVPLEASSLTFATIQEEAIQKKVEKIKTEHTINAVQKKVIYSVTLAGLGYVSYQFFYGGQPSAPVAQAGVADQSPTPLATIVPQQERQSSQLTAAGSAYLDKMAREELAKSNRSFIPAMYYWAKENVSILAQQTLVLAIFTGLNNSLGPIAKRIADLDGALDKVLSHVFHDWDLAWFLKKHTQISVLFASLEYHAARIERSGEDMNADDVHTPYYHARQLQRTWNIMMQQFEDSFAFMNFAMTYKKWYPLAVLQAQELQGSMKQEIAHTAQLLEMRVNHYFDNENASATPSLLSIVQDLHKNIYQDWHAFEELEKLELY